MGNGSCKKAFTLNKGVAPTGLGSNFVRLSTNMLSLQDKPFSTDWNLSFYNRKGEPQRPGAPAYARRFGRHTLGQGVSAEALNKAGVLL